MTTPSDTDHAKHVERISAINRPDVEAFLASKGDLAPSTLRNYAKALADLDAAVGEPWSQVSPTVLAGYFNNLRAKRLAPNSQALQRTLCKAFYRWLLVDEQTSGRFWQVFSMRIVPQRKKAKALSREQVAQITEAARTPRNRTLISALADTGFRRSEVCALNVGNVTFDKHGAFIELPQDAPPGYLKTGPREIYVTECVPQLRLWLGVHPRGDDPGAPLFPSGGGTGGDGTTRLKPGALSITVRRVGQTAASTACIRTGSATHEPREPPRPTGRRRR